MVGPHTGRAEEERALFECGAVAEGTTLWVGKGDVPVTPRERREGCPAFLRSSREAEVGEKCAGRGGGRAEEEGENNGRGRDTCRALSKCQAPRSL